MTTRGLTQAQAFVRAYRKDPHHRYDRFTRHRQIHSETALNKIKMMLDMRQPRKDAWSPPVIQTRAREGRGIHELLGHAQSHMQLLKTRGLDDYREQKALAELTTHFKKILVERVLRHQNLKKSGK